MKQRQQAQLRLHDRAASGAAAGRSGSRGAGAGTGSGLPANRWSFLGRMVSEVNLIINSVERYF